MNINKRKQREWTEIVVDPRTPYMIGRLLGANEMAVALLSQEDNDTAKRVAEVLDRVGAFFMQDAVHAKTNPVVGQLREGGRG